MIQVWEIVRLVQEQITIVAPDGWSISLAPALPTLTSNMTIRTETTGGYLTITSNIIEL
ncbi:MAG: hypothetical protein R3F25_09250 [Gammaproteobacteria bacterium]